MKPHLVAVATCVVLAACGGSDAVFGTGDGSGDGDSGSGTGGNTGSPITGDRTLPPGTASPTARTGIFRSEPTSTEAGYTGNGFARDVRYNAADDTFSVDNLGFDGDNTYSRGTAVGSLGPYAVYEADAQFLDSFDGEPVNQFRHRAIYGVSTSGNTQFAIVRTGAYVGYGFGGFIYQRNNEVNLPTTGQALFSGSLAGLRDYNGVGALEYTTADIRIAIDFDDFNDTTGTRGDAVRGEIRNRRIFDTQGNDVTETTLNRINTQNNATLREIPTATFTVGPGVMDDNGEILGQMTSYFTNNEGQTLLFEEGNYYAIVSGDRAQEIVGVVVLETKRDPAATSVRETGGFIVYN